MPTPTLPNRLRQLRLQHDMRLVDVAALVGKDQSMVVRYERGTTEVPNDVMRRLARHYDVSIEYLMGWDGDREAA